MIALKTNQWAMAAAVSNVSDVGSASWNNMDSFSVSVRTSEYVKGSLNFESSKNAAGWAFEKLTGGSASGSVSAETL